MRLSISVAFFEGALLATLETSANEWKSEL